MWCAHNWMQIVAWLNGEVGKTVPQYILALNDNAPLKAKAMFDQGGVEALPKH